MAMRLTRLLTRNLFCVYSAILLDHGPHFEAIPSFGEKDWETQNGVVRKRIVSFCAEATWTCVITKD